MLKVTPPEPRNMNSKHYILIAVAVGVVAGFVLANAPTGTGIYGTPLIGQQAANIYVLGSQFGGGATA